MNSAYPRYSFLLIATVVLVGVGAGIGGTTFIYARGYSYLSNDPRACVNCHVMNEQFEGWMKGGHQHVAGCNDCHVPHDFFGKWLTKMENGFHHSWKFTFSDVPVNIVARPASRAVVEGNCRYCHARLATNAVHDSAGAAASLSCLSCHRHVGHKQ